MAGWKTRTAACLAVGAVAATAWISITGNNPLSSEPEPPSITAPDNGGAGSVEPDLVLSGEVSTAYGAAPDASHASPSDVLVSVYASVHDGEMSAWILACAGEDAPAVTADAHTGFAIDGEISLTVQPGECDVAELTMPGSDVQDAAYGTILFPADVSTEQGFQQPLNVHNANEPDQVPRNAQIYAEEAAVKLPDVWTSKVPSGPGR